MQIKKNNILRFSTILQFLAITLFVVAPFVMTFEDEEGAIRMGAQMLPEYMLTITSALRWSILGAMLIISFFMLRRYKISTPVLFLTLFYFIQFVYAAVDVFEYRRFFSMTILCLFVPPLLGYIIKTNKNIVKYLLYSITFLLVVSLLLNGQMILEGRRFLGFMANPNAYGATAVFWLAIILYADSRKLIKKSFFFILLTAIFLTTIFSGSRNALVGLCIVIVFSYYKQINKLIGVSMVLLVITALIAQFIDIAFATERLGNIAQAFTDTERDEIWARAQQSINQNFWFGNGMDANWRIVGIGNMHNSYIRFLLNMGIIYTVLALLMYFISIASAHFNKRVPPVFVGYLIAFALMNVGEDFFVGLGSVVFVNLLFVYGFINYYITNTDSDTDISN